MTVVINPNGISTLPNVDGNKDSVAFDGIAENVKEIIHKISQSDKFQKLTLLTENNPWHDHENVLTHVKTVFANLEKLLTLDFITSPKIRKDYSVYFGQTIDPAGTLTRKEALLLACALHDLGKGEIRAANDAVAPGDHFLVTKADGTTTGKGHEHASALLVPKMLAPYGLTLPEIEYIQTIVEHHDQYSLDYCSQFLSGYKGGDMQEDVNQMFQVQPEYAVELVFHIIADEWGASISQWKTRYLVKILESGLLL